MKHYIKKAFSILTGMFALIGLSTTLLTVVMLIAISQFQGEVSSGSGLSAPDIDDSIIEIELDGVIQSRSMDPRSQFFNEVFGGPRGYQLSDLRKMLRRAAEDIRVRGVFVNMRNPVASFSTMQELRRSFIEFRKSEKPLYVNLYAGDTLTYFLASAGEVINLAPLGGLMIPGPAFQLTYFGPALEKLGVEMEVFQAGKYKSAMEPFVRSEPSEPSLEMYRSMESSLRQSLIKAIGESRGKPETDVGNWLRVSSFTSAQALSMGAVDMMDYETALLDKLKEVTKTDKLVKWRPYLVHSADLDEPRIADGDDKVGYVEASGEIRMSFQRGEENVIAPKPLIKELRWLAKQEDVKAIVFRVNSPGGSALASDLIWEEVRKLNEVKPVVVSMGQVAASGGYYIAAPASKIFAEAQTITGSIGVIGASLVGKDVPDKYGVHFHVVTQSERAKYLNFTESASAEDKRIIGESIDDVYQTFLDRVAQGRAKTKEQIHELAQGRVYTGQEALELGLVDHLGGRREAFRMAKELGQLNPEKLYPVMQYQPEPRSFFDCLGAPERMMECLSELEGGIQSMLIADPVAKQVLKPMNRLQKLLQDDEVLMYWPGQVRWSHGSDAL
ncbi:signal peptide peptidase SppA [Pseudobacteriovorax antillogorgiicola]|uniref:Protease-4 n=1 Tax=Pseudobacteriovorax antillogorgiicola TaxID=1513793 RepID=A0A1Y6BRY8_9BACT|nr:signal peptide peptidase SppA [Pseudobacteriovorax antillogorgiicola]TCS53161.1 protease-4 [Pseudobacteriovorax antillogorgiicola]SMF25060.1 protease-4 [Pseudobacteriovorax antillogorgiicola]